MRTDGHEVGAGAQGGKYPESDRSGDSDVTRIGDLDRVSDVRLGYATRTGDSSI